MAELVRVASCQELPEGSKKSVEVAGRAIVLFHVAGGYYAIDDICTHDGGPLGDGVVIGCEIMCPRHGARFDVRTGKALCMPAFEPVATYRVEVSGDEILIAVD